MVRTLRATWPAVTIAIVALVPFFDKAFTLDDTLFLRVAEHALQEPLAPMSFSYTWAEHSERMSELLANGPIGGYLLVPVILAGGAEWIAHVIWWMLLGATLIATVSLGMRIGLSAVEAGFAGVLVATSPVVLEMASTNMPDIPALALAAIGMERLFAWSEERRWHQAVTMALALGLAPLARSQTILLWPLAALVPLIGVPRWDAKTIVFRKLAPLVALPVILWSTTRLTADPVGAGGLVETTKRFFFWDRLEFNAIAWVLHYALATPLVFWLVLRLRSARLWWPIVFAAAVWWALPLLYIYGLRRLPLALLAGLTATAVADMAVDALRRRDLTRAVLVGWSLISLPIITYLHMSAKYFVPSAPALALLLVLIARELPERYARVILAAGAVAGLAVGLMIVQADARYADLGRRAAAELIAPRVAQGQKVWFAGHWGFQWYAEQAGARGIKRDPPLPAPGDAIVSPTNMHGFRLVRLVPSRRLVTSIAERRPGGRLMSAGAGFWSNAWGFLPWVWSSDLAEQFDLWQVPISGADQPAEGQ